MRRTDPKTTALASLLRRPPERGWTRAVELVAVAPGDLAARAGTRGRWVTAVVSGSVSTTVPPRHYAAGDALTHDGRTALLSPDGALLLTADARDEVAEALLTACAAPEHGSARQPTKCSMQALSNSNLRSTWTQ